MIDTSISISLSVFGIRNLMFECIKPEIHVYLTNDIEKENMKVFKLPDLGIVPLKNTETGEMRWYNTSSSEFQEEFENHHRKQQEEFTMNLRKRGIDSIEISTTEDYYKALVELFHRRKS
mgnify:CR=1 FL=1